nr:GH1 family beta-glucosidase [Magnetospirillum molischianum]
MKPNRRQFLAGFAAMTVVRPTEAAPSRQFPKDFFWGASSAAYQIEGATETDGRGPSIWDTFTANGHIMDGSSARIACDHYHRYAEDVALMKQAGFSAYRFSLGWPRIVPAGTGAVNPKGLEFYDRLVDKILKAGIRPMACLYHWDLPQPLEDMGGWQSREIVGPFADYARIAVARLGDRVKDWYPLNEPNVVAVSGYGTADHAPGLRAGDLGILKVLHHQNLAQGAAFRAIRAERPNVRVGTICNLQPSRPENDEPLNRAAAIRWDAVWNRVALDGVLRGAIPDVLAEKMAPIVKPGDLETIRFPIDSLGINYYSRMTMRHEPGRPFDVGWGDAHCNRWTGMALPVQPDGLYDLLLELKTLYGNPEVFVAENGAAYDDVVSPDGQVHDPERVAFLKDHVAEVARALKDGCNVKGYLVWSLLDNFEWAFGLSKRFGIVRVDFDTLKRTPKDSYRWFAEVIRTGRVG